MAFQTVKSSKSRRCLKGLGRKPGPRETMTIRVNQLYDPDVFDFCDYEIDYNDFDIYEGDRVFIRFSFTHPEWIDGSRSLYCCFDKDDEVEAFELGDDWTIEVPKNFITPGDVVVFLHAYANTADEGASMQYEPNDNEAGFMTLDLSQTPIRVMSWFDRSFNPGPAWKPDEPIKGV